MHEELLIVKVKCKMHKNYSLYYEFHTQKFFKISCQKSDCHKKAIRTVRYTVMLLPHCTLLMVPWHSGHSRRFGNWQHPRRDGGNSNWFAQWRSLCVNENCLTNWKADTNLHLTFRGPCIVIYSYNKSQRDALFLNFILVRNSTCFRQIYCPSSGVLILYSQQLVFVMLVLLN